MAGGGFRIAISVYSARGRDAPKTATARDQYCRYLRNLIARYPQINDVEIWIEPNKTHFWAPQFGPAEEATAPAQYTALLARCWDVLHAFRPGVNVVAPGTSPRGNDRPDARSNISQSPGNFIRRMAAAYRASGRRLPIFDTVGHNAYGEHAAERPWRRHRFSRTISEGDLDKLLQALWDGFHGTGQPIPGRCVAGKCVPVWYLEIGYQTKPDPDKAHLYSGVETDPHPLPAYAGGEPESVRPTATSLAPDQATQILDGIRLAFCQPFVEAYFIFNLDLWDHPDLFHWQSAAFWADRSPKPSLPSFQQAIAEANERRVACASLKGGPVGRWRPRRGVDVAALAFSRRADRIRARVRTAEDAVLRATLVRAAPLRAIVATRRRGLRLGYERTVAFPLAGLRPGSYRVELRMVSRDNPERVTTRRSRSFTVGELSAAPTRRRG